jgi:FAD:protein FMN transferase
VGTFVAACLMVGLMGETPDNAANLMRFEFTRTEMAVPILIIMYATDDATAAAAADAAFDRIHQLNAILSDYDEESELRQLCVHSSEGHTVPVSEDLWRVLQRALELSAKTDGAFDPSIGPLVRLWRRARRTKELPSPEAIRSAISRVDYRAIRLHANSHAVELLKPNMLLDLGGIAKGYALEEAFQVLKAHGIDRALVRAGGDIVLGEAPPSQSGWRIGVGQLDPSNPPRFFLSLSRVEIATSGDRFQFVEIGGKRYSHIIDPKTGLGLTERCQATVVVPQGTLADGLASSLCIRGSEKGLQMIEKIPGAAAYIISIPDNVPGTLRVLSAPDNVAGTLRVPSAQEDIRQSTRWKELPVAERE